MDDIEFREERNVFERVSQGLQQTRQEYLLGDKKEKALLELKNILKSSPYNYKENSDDYNMIYEKIEKINNLEYYNLYFLINSIIYYDLYKKLTKTNITNFIKKYTMNPYDLIRYYKLLYTTDINIESEDEINYEENMNFEELDDFE